MTTYLEYSGSFFDCEALLILRCCSPNVLNRICPRRGWGREELAVWNLEE